MEQGEVPEALLAPLREICLALPETSEEHAWRGIRWVVRKRNFAHVLAIDPGDTAGYARLLRRDDEVVHVLTFRSEGPELAVLKQTGPPFFPVGWGRDVMALVLDDPDWDEVQELITESYCVMAPKKLVALVDRPQD